MADRGPIAIDGPVASGKTTVGRGVAQRLGWTFIDTGLLYRAVGLLALQADTPDWSEAALAERAMQARITIDDMRVTIEDQDVSGMIRSPEASTAASRVAAIPGVRRVLVPIQRAMAERTEGRAVVVGRDIGTVVLWDAPLKVYLDASPQARAERRHAEMVARGEDSNFERVLADLLERDRRDVERADSPLKRAADAHSLTTDTLSPEQVINEVLRLADALP